MRVVVTEDWIEVEEGPKVPPGDMEWSCRKAAHVAAVWAMKRLSEELAKNLAKPGGGKIAMP